jgi:hypothetical protein
VPDAGVARESNPQIAPKTVGPIAVPIRIYSNGDNEEILISSIGEQKP